MNNMLLRPLNWVLQITWSKPVRFDRFLKAVVKALPEQDIRNEAQLPVTFRMLAILLSCISELTGKWSRSFLQTSYISRA
jgi:hypothetical protein